MHGPLRIEGQLKQLLGFDPLLSDSCHPELPTEKSRVVIPVAGFSVLSNRYGQPNLWRSGVGVWLVHIGQATEKPYLRQSEKSSEELARC